MDSAAKKAPSQRPLPAGGKIVFVGASTGGTEAVKTFLLGIPADCVPILIVQHMPESFTGSFAARLNSLCKPRVIEAQGGEVLESGVVYIAPGHSHLKIRRTPSGYLTELLKTPPVNRHRPSVDVLFDSAAEIVGRNAVGVILTGMGKDGACGLLRMRQGGARTFGQDEATCVVFGMPREAALSLAGCEADRLVQLAATLAVGSLAVWPASAAPLRESLPQLVREQIALADNWRSPAVHFDVVLHHGQAAELRELCAFLAQRSGAIIGVQSLAEGETGVALERLVIERSVSINTAAAGGNASLMTLD